MSKTPWVFFKFYNFGFCLKKNYLAELIEGQDPFIFYQDLVLSIINTLGYVEISTKKNVK